MIESVLMEVQVAVTRDAGHMRREVGWTLSSLHVCQRLYDLPLVMRRHITRNGTHVSGCSGAGGARLTRLSSILVLR